MGLLGSLILVLLYSGLIYQIKTILKQIENRRNEKLCRNTMIHELRNALYRLENVYCLSQQQVRHAYRRKEQWMKYRV